jgi:hypothetical protein
MRRTAMVRGGGVVWEGFDAFSGDGEVSEEEFIRIMKKTSLY